MKHRPLLRTMGTLVLMAITSIRQSDAQTSASSALPASIRARLLASNLDLSIIMPPMPPAPSPEITAARKAMLLKAKPMDDGISLPTPPSGGPTSPLTPSPSPQPQGGGSPLPPMYAVIDLGTLGGTYSQANGINNSGQVVGYAYTSTPASHAFLYSGSGPMQDLGTLGGNDGSQGEAINDSGVVVGSSWLTGNATYQAFRYSGNGPMQDLGTLGGSDSEALGINASGQITGEAYTTGNAANVPFLYNGSMQNLGTLGGNGGFAYGINASGEIVGNADITGSSTSHAFLYSGNGPMQDLGTLGGSYSQAIGINASGQIVGSSDTSSGGLDPFLYSNESMQDLGSLGGNIGLGRGINDLGQAVGASYTASGASHAFLYWSSAMYDLNTLLVNPTGWTLNEATSINNAGQIVGYGFSPSGNQHAFLLNPYPTLTYTPFYQGDGGTPGSGVPSDFGYDGTSTTTYGCALCSAAVMLTSLSVPGSMTPAQLNTDLTSLPTPTIPQNGYQNGDIMNWSVIGQVTGYPISYSAADSEQISSPTVLEQYLEDHCWGNRYRVIIQFTATETDDTTGVAYSGDHFVFVVGRTNGDWVLFDPGWKNAYIRGQKSDGVLSSLNGHYAGFDTQSLLTGHMLSWQFSIEGVRTFAVNPSSTAYASYVAHSPVEMLVTDPNGNRIGYNPVTSTNVSEILGASYVKDFALVDVNGDSAPDGETNGVKTVSIPSPLGGTYIVVLTGTASGSYTLDSGTYWPGNSDTVQTTTGTTDIGVLSTNTSFVIVPPLITTSFISNGMFNLSFIAQTNVTYALEGNESLTNTGWSSLQTVTATSTNVMLSQQMTAPMMFYRVKSQ